MNTWADQKPLKPIDGPFVFKSTMEYSETSITGDVKEITRTFDTSGTVLDLPDTATKAFIDIGLTNGVLPASDGFLSAVRTPPSSDLAVLSVPTLPVPAPTRDISPHVATSTLVLNPSSGTDGSITTRSLVSSQQSSLIQLQLVKVHGFLSAVTVIANRTRFSF